MLTSERARERGRFSRQRLCVATEYERGWEVAPHDSAIDRAKISLKQRPEIQTTQSSVHKLHPVYVLVLGEYRSLMQERRELLEERVALAIGHERQAERRCYRVHPSETALAEFGFKILNT